MKAEIVAAWLEAVRDPLARWMDIPELPDGTDMETALIVHQIHESEGSDG